MKSKRRDEKLIQKVATNIKRYRTRKGWPQEKLQLETGLLIARYESGKKDMTLTTVSILSEKLEVEPFELLK